MFGFKHTMNGFDHHEQKVARTRLFGRLLQVNGPLNLARLYPYLQQKLVTGLEAELQKGISVDGNVVRPRSICSSILIHFTHRWHLCSYRADCQEACFQDEQSDLLWRADV